MSFFTGPPPSPGNTAGDEDQAAIESPATGPGRRAARTLVAGLAFLLVLFALAAPDDLARLSPLAFLRVPVEGPVGVAVLLMLPGRARRVAAALGGVLLGLLAVLKAFDLGFSSVLDRPFDPLHDWGFVAAAVEFVDGSAGRAAAVGATAAAVTLAAAVLAGMVLSALRLTRVAVRHGTAATGAVTVLGVTWVVCTLAGTQIVPDVPVATQASGRVAQIRASLLDRKVFAAQVADDPYHDATADRLLTALRGKDVVLAFVESYGRSALTDPRYATEVRSLLAAGTRRLDAAGFSSRSAYLTSPTSGGGSWLAHSTLLSGLWVNSQQRYDALVETGRLTLNRAFQRAGWRTVGVMPGITRDWPEGRFFGYDHVYDARTLGYRGPRFNWGTMPDQYTLNTFQRTERAKPGRRPVMAEIALVSSHAPWAPVPTLTGWPEVGDGSSFKVTGDTRDTVWQDPARVRTEYGRALRYSLNALIGYVETYGDDDLVVIFLGDHQPAPIITGDTTDRAVPVTLMSKDPAVLHRTGSWHWSPGLAPTSGAPAWPMNTFRDHFLTTFSPGLDPAHLTAHPAR